MGWNRLVRRLVADGAEVDVIDSNGLSPIDYALGRFPKEFNALVPEQHTDTVALLQSFGAQRREPHRKLPAGHDAENPGDRALRGAAGGLPGLFQRAFSRKVRGP